MKTSADSTSKPMRTLLVDDHVLFRQGLSNLLDRQEDFEVVGEASSVGEAIQMFEKLKPELVIMDFRLPDGSGVEATRTIMSQAPFTRIVFLTMHEEDDLLFSAIRSGAQGYLLKNLGISKLLASLRALKQGEAAISRRMTSRILEEFSRSEQPANDQSTMLEPLTTREVEIFFQLVEGASNQEIAERLFISQYTVKNHVHNILEKLKLENRRQVASYAARHRLQHQQTGKAEP